MKNRNFFIPLAFSYDSQKKSTHRLKFLKKIAKISFFTLGKCLLGPSHFLEQTVSSRFFFSFMSVRAGEYLPPPTFMPPVGPSLDIFDSAKTMCYNGQPGQLWGKLCLLNTFDTFETLLSRYGRFFFYLSTVKMVSKMLLFRRKTEIFKILF